MPPRPFDSPVPVFVLATGNPKKREELAALLDWPAWQLRSLADFPQVTEPEESGGSFAENAAIKARHAALGTGCWSVGDDSGLAVDVLHGAPGIHSARFAGPGATAQQNLAKLLQLLTDVPVSARTAHFECHLAVADPSGQIRATASGRCRGRLLDAARGGGGFGYDPIFLVPEYGRTFAELSPVVKGAIGHRGRAVQRLLPQLIKLCGDSHLMTPTVDRLVVTRN